MCQRKSRNGGEPKPVPVLRRSPRFIDGSAGTENRSGEISKKEERKSTESKGSRKSSGGSRRSTRLKDRATTNCPDLQNRCVVEKRVTRSSVRRIKCSSSADNACPRISRRGERRATLATNLAKSAEDSRRPRKTEEVHDSKKRCVAEKRVTRSSVRRNNLISEFDSAVGVRVSPKGSNAEAVCDSIARVTRRSNRTKSVPLVYNDNNDSDRLNNASKRDGEECGIDRGNAGANFRNKAQIGEKRKRCKIEENEVVQGWSEEQELALQKAYFTAKPTPHFWKKVARMVPGKSAEQCFDRIHSDHLTPSQPRTRSRAKKANPSPLSFSASKLLSPPPETKAKRNRCNRRKTLMAKKTVRQLLRKCQQEDQDYEADFFAVLEPTTNSSPLNFQNCSQFASPLPNQGSGIPARSRDKSSSATIKHRSRLNTTQKAPFVSPPVLKQVKNRALHERYLDQLQTRDAKREAELLRNSKCKQNKNDLKASNLDEKSVKFAKDALVSGAQDAINHFRRILGSMDNGIDDDHDDDASFHDKDDNGNEDELT